MGMGNIATTGMQAAMSDMEIISNNIANANTWGFKKSSANFADIFPTGNGASSSTQIGLGVSLSSVQQDFSPGGTALTNVSSNLSIGGSGFFILRDATTSQQAYTRNGQFSFNQNQGYFMVGNQRLQGFLAVNGAIPAGSSPGDLLLSTTPLSALATTTVTQQQLNLDSNDSVPVGVFNPSDSTTFNFASTATVLDSLGNSNILNLYYIKSSSNNWTVNAQVNGTTIGTGSLTFSTSGQLTSTTGLSALSFNPTGGAAAPQVFAVNMTGASQFAATDATSPFTNDGYSAGTYQGYTIDQNGMVNVQYSNKQSVLAGQIAIADFPSQEGLQNIGGGTWIATSNSGSPIVLASNSTGNVEQGSLEMSNVDLATEMVNLINAQNTFQANAQVEQTFNQVMQTVTKL